MSAHFNIGFGELLALFAGALRTEDIDMQNTDSLQAIIRELSVENERNMFQVPAGKSTPERLKTGTEGVVQDIELIRYYLSSGSFPWWASDLDRQGLEQLVRKLIARYPQTMYKLIRNTGQKQYSRELMVRTFSEELLHETVTLIEPENAGFIFDYVAEVKTVHKKSPVLKVQTGELTTAVWEFILEFLLVDRGSEFNRLMFLESNIRKLANRFNVKYRELLVFMVQSIAVSHHSSARHLALFQGLTHLYKEGFADTILPERPSEKAEIAGKVKLRNVLYFWIRFGYMPWWAEEYSGSPSALFEQLIGESPEEALRVFQYAGLAPGTRRRIVYQLPLTVLEKIFLLIPGGTQALEYLENLARLLRENKLPALRNDSMTENILLFSLWDSFIATSYKSFKPALFLRSAIAGLARWFQIPARNLAGSFDERRYPQQFTGLFSKVYQEISVSGFEQLESLPEWVEYPEIEQFISDQLSISTLPDEHQKRTVFDEALFILGYYLQYNKLPDHYRISSEGAVNAFLKRLILLLHKEKPSDLKSLLNSGLYPAENLIRIHEIFTARDTTEDESVHRLLSSFLDQHILLYIREKGLSSADSNIIEFIDGYLKRPLRGHSREFLRSLFKYSSVSSRLAYYYENETIYTLLKDNLILTGWGEQNLTFLKAHNSWLSEEILQDNQDRKRLALLFRTFGFMMIGGGIRLENFKDYLHYFFRFLYEKDYQLLLKIAALLDKRKDQQRSAGAGIEKFLPVIKKQLFSYAALQKNNDKLIQVISHADRVDLHALGGTSLKKEKEEELKQLKQEIGKEILEEKKESEKEILSDAGTIYINNAGLVLLHPFLSTYFNRLEMLEKGDFVSEEARHRAVHLLQYLAFGTETNEEQELVLNKILCNMPVEEPVELDITLTEQEKTVSAELLNAVLVQWEKLKNTSAESLRTSFLQRQGGIIKNEENWTLRVEQRGYDVLLQTLPWGIGMVKTPWMSEIIYVEWM